MWVDSIVLHEDIVVNSLQWFVDIFDSVHHKPYNTIITGIKDCVDAHYKAEPLPHYLVKPSYAYAQLPLTDSGKERRPYCHIYDGMNSNLSLVQTDSGSYNRFEELTCENLTLDGLLFDSPRRSGTDILTDIL